jgi:hypothetical protein
LGCPTGHVVSLGILVLLESLGWVVNVGVLREHCNNSGKNVLKDYTIRDNKD